MGIQNFFLDDFLCDRKTMRIGGEAYVVKGKHSKHGEVAVKTWPRRSGIKIKEVELLMENAYHQNIIQILGILIDDDSRCIGYIMPYMPIGSLEDVIHNKSQHYDEQQIKSWILQICYGLSYLHDKNIIHRDIKPSNVLLGKSCDDLKLSDFGVAKSFESNPHSMTIGVGTLAYMASEIFKSKSYTTSVDIYSLSITIWEIVHRKHLYDHVTNKFDLIIKIPNGERPQLNNTLSKEISDLLTSCWDADASKRPTIDYVLELCEKITFSLVGLENTVKEIENSPGEKTILLLGGNNRTDGDSLLMLENNGQNWKLLNIKLPYAVHSHGAQFLNNSIYIFGGEDKEDKFLNWTYRLSKSLPWEKMADMNQKRDAIISSSVILKKQIWVLGGRNEKLDELKSVEMYDPETNKWKYMKDMNERRSYAATAVVSEKIFCCGGEDAQQALGSVEYYDPSSDVWILICDMPRSITGHGAVEMNGNFVVMGGYNDRGYFKNVWELNTTDKNAVWIEKSSMSIPRGWSSIAKIDDKIFVCGGESNYKLIGDMEVFDGKVWRNGPNMPTVQRYSPVVVIPIEFTQSL